MKKSRLGRSLDMLLSGQPFEDLLQAEIPPTKEELRQMPIENLQPGKYQPRREFPKETLETLAESIRTQGIINPIIARPTQGEQYEIIAGERRWRAAQLASLSEIPVIVKSISNETALALSLIENIQRQDLNPIEEAEGVQRLINEFGLTHQEVANSLGRSRATITNLLRLLSLAPKVKGLLQNNQLEMGHARALLSLSETLQIEVSEKIVKDHLSVREAERFVRNKSFIKNPPGPDQVSQEDRDIQLLERSLSEQLGAKVRFKHHSSGKGQLLILYNNLEELDGILSQFHKEKSF